MSNFLWAKAAWDFSSSEVDELSFSKGTKRYGPIEYVAVNFLFH